MLEQGAGDEHPEAHAAIPAAAGAGTAGLGPVAAALYVGFAQSAEDGGVEAGTIVEDQDGNGVRRPGGLHRDFRCGELDRVLDEVAEPVDQLRVAGDRRLFEAGDVDLGEVGFGGDAFVVLVVIGVVDVDRVGDDADRNPLLLVRVCGDFEQG